jgi:ribosomal silencing factor RsfS
MKPSDIVIYESLDKSEVLYLDITKKVEISDEWKFCRVASEEDMKRLNDKEKAQLKENGTVVKSGIKVRIY